MKKHYGSVQTKKALYETMMELITLGRNIAHNHGRYGRAFKNTKIGFTNKEYALVMKCLTSYAVNQLGWQLVSQADIPGEERLVVPTYLTQSLGVRERIRSDKRLTVEYPYLAKYKMDTTSQVFGPNTASESGYLNSTNFMPLVVNAVNRYYRLAEKQRQEQAE